MCWHWFYRVGRYDPRRSLLAFQLDSVVHVFRESNMLADSFVKHGLTSNREICFYFLSIPDFTKDSFIKDTNVTVYSLNNN